MTDPLPAPPPAVHEVEELRVAVERLQAAERLQHALYAITDLASAGLGIHQTLQRLHAVVGGLMPAENFFVAQYDDATATITFQYFADIRTESPPIDTPIPLQVLEQGLTWYVIHDRKPLRGSLEEIGRQVSGPLRARGVDAADWLGVPMLDGADVSGVLVVQSYEHKGIYDEASQALLTFVASHVQTALQRWHTHDALERAVASRTAELASANTVLRAEVAARQRGENLQQALYRLAELSSSPVSSDEFHREVHDVVGGLLNAANYFVVLPSADGTELHVPYHVDERDPTIHRRPAGRGLTEYVWRTGKPLLAEPEQIRELELSGEVKVWGAWPTSWLGVPLRCEGATLGVLAVQSYTPETRYNERDRDLLVFVSHQIASSLERRRAADALRDANTALELRVEERTRELREQIQVRERVEEQLKHEVVHDALTGLPNRKYLHDRLSRLCAAYRRDTRRVFAVMFMDIDRFKLINDSMGHHVGDEVLREMAKRLKGALREPDVVARLGGDEFAALLENAAQPDAAAHIAQRLLKSLEPPMLAGGREIVISSSIGIVISDDPDAGADDLLRQADAAMYRAKANGRHRFEFYDKELHLDAMRVLDLESELREAIKGNEFIPYFQPVVDLRSRKAVGCEALVRWKHPRRGIIGPAEFLKTADDNGSIEDIDWLVYDAACAAVARRSAKSGSLALNVSPRHLKRETFVPKLLAVLDWYGLAPSQVCLEITESALIDSPQTAAARLRRLREAGVQLALDDFGTGFSSLAHVHQLPFSVLKIDRSFVAGLDPAHPSEAGRAVVKAIMALGRSLDLKVIAEGVETEGQRLALLELDCTLAQGYLFAPPLAAPPEVD